MDFFKKPSFLYPFFLTLSGFITRFIFWGYPAQVVFDEVHFGKFISGYFTHQYFFDIHPPLAKLLLSAMGWLGGFQPGFSFSNIGEAYANNYYLWLRFLPALAGALIPLVVYFFCRRLNFSKLAAFLAGIFMVFENSMIVQSRFILLDSILLLFGFGGLLLYLTAREKKSSRLKLFSAVLMAFSFSIKWTGVSFIAIAGMMEFFSLLKNRPFLKIWLKSFFVFIVIPFLIYFSVFFVHFSLLNHSGPGDDFMTPAFQKTLVGNSYQNDAKLKAPSVFGKFLELNAEMLKTNEGKLEHSYGSKWYTWPFMARPIYYWVGSSTPATGADTALAEPKIYFLGNPLVYWLSTLAIIILFFFTLFRHGFVKNKKAAYLIIAGYLINFLPFIFIKRVMFLYHYLAALIFAVMALALLVDSIQSEKKKKIIVAVLIYLCIMAFLFFSPLTYGLPLSPHAQNWLFWFPSWQ